VAISKQWHGIAVHHVPVDQCDDCGEQFLDPYAIGMLSAATRKRRAG